MAPEQQQLEAGIAALEAQRAVLGDVVADAALAGLRDKLAALQAAGRASEPAQTLKQVSILFLDIAGSTELSRHLDPETLSTVIDGALARATAIVDAHRGRALQYAGDNLLAAFGADEVREDDAERAVRCGLALLALGRELRAQVEAAHGRAGFDVRVGIHTGDVLLGGGVNDQGTIRGLAVNLAARMEQLAPVGALRITHDTYARVRGVFDVIPQEPLAVKGLDTPLQTYLVQRAKPRAFRVATRGIEGVSTRMVGRDAELQALQAAFLRLQTPGAGLERAIVVAEAGLGKSRLLDEFQNWAEARSESFFLFQARATPETQGQAYGMLRDLLAWRLQIADGDSMQVAQRKLEKGLMPLFAQAEGEHEAEGRAHLLGQLIGLDYAESRHIRGIRDDAQQIRSRGFHAAALALRRIAEQGRCPIVAQLDDLHWADDGSLDFFDYLCRVDVDVPVLLLGLTRPSLFERRPSAAAAGAAGELRIALAPLDRESSHRLVEELLKKLPEVPAALRELVTGGADGNPFYLEERVKMLIDQRALVTHGERWSLDAARLLSLKVPSTLTGLLQARLDSLPAPERHGLQLASVIGLEFWDRALAHVDAAAPAQLPALVRRELVQAQELVGAGADAVREFAFSHQLLHQVTYDTVLKSVKREAHGRVADWLARHSGARARPLLATAAEHYERAGDSANAAEFYTRAAEHLGATFAHDAALDCTARALGLIAADAPDRQALRWRLLANRERTLDLLGRRSEQMLDIEALITIAEALPPGTAGDAQRAEAAWRRCDIAMRTGDWGVMEREARRARDWAESAGAVELELRAVQRLAAAIAYQGDPASALPIARAGLARAGELGWPLLQARLANAAAVCAQQQGDAAACLQYNELSLSFSRASGNRRAEALDLGNVGMGYLCLGDYTQARPQLEEALRLNRLLGNREVEGNILAALSELAWRQDDAEQAIAQAQAALAITIEVGSLLFQTIAQWSLGNAELMRAGYAAAQTAFERSEALGREIAVQAIVLNALEGQARVALARADDTQALAAAARLLTEAGLDPASSAADGVAGNGAAGNNAAANGPFAGANQHLIRATLHQVWSRTGDPRAGAALAAAQGALGAEAEAISDAALRRSFLANVPEHRRIMAGRPDRRGAG